MARAIFQSESVARLVAELPVLDPGMSLEDQARATLRYLLDQIKTRPSETSAEVDPMSCPNCGRPASSTRSPYCSPECRDEAAFVRQFRAGLADGSIFDPERQVAFGQNLWFILGGGRPLRRGLIPDKVIAKVIEKAGGRCAGCGAPATTIDHIGTACNRPINLRPACANCCRTRDFGDPSVAYQVEFLYKLKQLAARVASPEPLRVCDDASAWDWRAYVAQRKPKSDAK